MEGMGEGERVGIVNDMHNEKKIVFCLKNKNIFLKTAEKF